MKALALLLVLSAALAAGMNVTINQPSGYEYNAGEPLALEITLTNSSNASEYITGASVRAVATSLCSGEELANFTLSDAGSGIYRGRYAPMIPTRHNLNFYASAQGFAKSSASKVISVLGDAMLIPDCTVEPDAYGYAEIRATGGYFTGRCPELACDRTTVTADVGGKLNRYIGCEFSKYVLIPLGTGSITYSMQYPGGTLQRTCTVKPPTPSFELTVYSPEQGATYVSNDTIPVSAALLMNGEVLTKADVSATLGDETVSLTADYYGIYKGAVHANTGTLRITARYSNLLAEKTVGINAVAPGTANVTAAAMRIIALPLEGTYEANNTIAIIAEVEDASGMIVSKANVTASLSLNGTEITRLQMHESAYTYSTLFTPLAEGVYSLALTAAKGGNIATLTLPFQVGALLTPTSDLTVDVLSPKTGTYAPNSSIVVRARVLYKNEPLKNATVSMDFLGGKKQMTYDKYGEYVTTVQPPEGRYELGVVATYGSLVSEGKATFLVSRHTISLDLLSPTDNRTIRKGESVTLSVNVLDEAGDVVNGVSLTATIIEPQGRVLEMPIFQSPATGEYTTVFYPDDDGVYKISLLAGKEDYLESAVESTFAIELKKEAMPITTETLLTIALAIAVLILLAAVLKVIF